MCAMNIHASALTMDFSRPLANRQHRFSHTKVRSTTHLRGITSKPSALSERLTIWIVQFGCDQLPFLICYIAGIAPICQLQIPLRTGANPADGLGHKPGFLWLGRDRPQHPERREIPSAHLLLTFYSAVCWRLNRRDRCVQNQGISSESLQNNRFGGP